LFFALRIQSTNNLKKPIMTTRINNWINLKAQMFNALTTGENKNTIKENWKYPSIKSIAFNIYVLQRKTKA
tara:strand:- start:1428 stop:1640 length:213 start_codon:yes stop_codon:yes gene_type:complete